MPAEKRCSKCEKVLSLENFYKVSKSKDGFSYWCNQCRKDNVKKHRLNPAYRARQLEWNNKWRFRPENRELVLSIRRKSQKKIFMSLKKAGFVTPLIRETILERDHRKCLNCKSEKNLTMDHILPVSKGGITIDDNLQTLCNSCNSVKQQKNTDFRH